MLNFEYKIKDQINSKQFTSDLEKFRELIDNKGIGFYHLSNENKLLEESKSVYKKHQHKKHFVLIGIGGSSLGPITLIKALRKNQDVNFIFLDNIDSDYTYDELGKVNPKDCVVYVVSKSGGTAETMANMCLVISWLKENGISEDKFKDIFVFSTDPVKSDLLTIAEKYKIDCLTIPSNIGGRFSIFTSVGLFPALFAGINIDEIFSGSNKIKENLLNTNFENNDLFKTAYTLFDLYKKNITQTVLMPYSSKLRDFSFWFVQLWAESLGKNSTTGFTPIPASGATDQHSQMQLFMEGPNDKVIFLIDIENRKHDFKLNNNLEINSANQLSDCTLNQLMKAELEGSFKALEVNNRNIIRISISELNENSFAALVLFFESLTALMGNLLNIDAFNQPGVEKGKIFAFEYLNSQTK